MPRDCIEARSALWSCVIQSACGAALFAEQRDPAKALGKEAFQVQRALKTKQQQCIALVPALHNVLAINVANHQNRG